MFACQSARTIGRWCLRPGPYCGKKQGQWFEYMATTWHRLAFERHFQARCDGRMVSNARQQRSTIRGYAASKKNLRR